MVNYYSPKRKSAVYLFFLKSVIMPIQTDKVTIHTIITIIHPPHSVKSNVQWKYLLITHSII